MLGSAGGFCGCATAQQGSSANPPDPIVKQEKPEVWPGWPEWTYFLVEIIGFSLARP
jgi:hypothetical protein